MRKARLQEDKEIMMRGPREQHGVFIRQDKYLAMLNRRVGINIATVLTPLLRAVTDFVFDEIRCRQ
jgi:hypothetical protein